MVQVPSLLRSVFETFPLKTYPPIPNTTAGSKQAIESNRLYFESASKSNSNDSFILGVPNVLALDNDKYIPTDPISLAQCLILCYKHKLKLPSNSSSNKCPHSLLKMSHHASEDGQLPILIENGEDSSRTIRSCKSFTETINDKYFKEDIQAFFINNLIDHDLNDLWILSLLVEISRGNLEVVDQIFKIDEALYENEHVKFATSVSLLKEIPNWNSFRIRHASLFDTKKSSSINYPLRYVRENALEFQIIDNPKAINSYYEDQLSKFNTTLELLVDYITPENTQLPKKIIELKVIAFVICIDKILGKDTQIYKVLTQKKFEGIIDHSYNVISKDF